MTALPVEAPRTAPATPEPATSASDDDDPLQPAIKYIPAPCGAVRSCALDLSRSRTYDAVLDILKAYKLSGNFHGNLDAVLRDMGVFDMVTYHVEPGPALAFPDCRHVVFTLNDNVPDGALRGIVKAIRAKIGFDAPWWGRVLRRPLRAAPLSAQAEAQTRTRY